MIGDADFSSCGNYRYALRRQWMLGKGSVLWVLLNPSTATAELDDPTIRRCIGFAQGWGYQGMTLANVFALRSTNPKALRTHPYPEGPNNQEWLSRLSSEGHDLVIAAWGHHGAYLESGNRATLILNRQADVMCLGTTDNEQPRHPLYLAKTTPLTMFRRRAEEAVDW